MNDFVRFLAAWALVHESADEGWKAAITRGRKLEPGDPAQGPEAFVDGLDPRRNGFDAEGWRARWEAVRGTHGRYPWTFDPTVLDAFEIKRRPAAEGAATS